VDGWVFLIILKKCGNIKIRTEGFIEECTKWTHKLSNLKKMVAVIEDYFEEQVKKGIKTRDIDLLEIARNRNLLEVCKLFELVVATLTEAPNKEDHINTIMSLDDRTQSTFVSIIQNIHGNRILGKSHSKESKMMETITQLEMENYNLSNEVDCLLNENHEQTQEAEDLKRKLADCKEEVTRVHEQSIDNIQQLQKDPKEREYLKNMVENLKDKLVKTVRENEIAVAGYREEISSL
jgi:regulator of replication initiation timing